MSRRFRVPAGRLDRFVCLLFCFWKEDTLVFYVIVIEFWLNCFAKFPAWLSKLVVTRGLVPFVRSDLLSNGSNCEGETKGKRMSGPGCGQ